MKLIFSVIWSLGCLQIQKPHGSFYYRRSSKLNNCTESGNVCHKVNGEHMTKIVNQGCVLNLFILPYLYQFSPWFSIYWIVLLYKFVSNTNMLFMGDWWEIQWWMINLPHPRLNSDMAQIHRSGRLGVGWDLGRAAWDCWQPRRLEKSGFWSLHLNFTSHLELDTDTHGQKPSTHGYCEENEEILTDLIELYAFQTSCVVASHWPKAPWLG